MEEIQELEWMSLAKCVLENVLAKKQRASAIHDHSCAARMEDQADWFNVMLGGGNCALVAGRLMAGPDFFAYGGDAPMASAKLGDVQNKRATTPSLPRNEVLKPAKP